MKIKTYNGTGNGMTEDTLFRSIRSRVSYEGGTIEEIDAENGTLFDALDLLTDILYEKNILTNNDILRIADEFIYGFGTKTEIIKEQ